MWVKVHLAYRPAACAALALIVTAVLGISLSAAPAGAVPPGLWYGDASALVLHAPVVGIAVTPSGHGYWLAGADGAVFAFGDATAQGSLVGHRLNAPVVGIAASPSGRGYWLAASDGGVFSFGDARFVGSMGGRPLNRPIVGIAATPSGDGYWLAASDGGVFTFGAAPFYGSAANGVDFPSGVGPPVHAALLRPVSGITATPSGHGYWLVATDSGVFAYGDADCAHCGGGLVDLDTVGLAPFPAGKGFALVRTGAGFSAVLPEVNDQSFGHLGFFTLFGGSEMTPPLVGIAGNALVYWVVNQRGAVYPAFLLQD
jgi:hypothetical protein